MHQIYGFILNEIRLEERDLCTPLPNALLQRVLHYKSTLKFHNEDLDAALTAQIDKEKQIRVSSLKDLILLCVNFSRHFIFTVGFPRALRCRGQSLVQQ